MLVRKTFIKGKLSEINYVKNISRFTEGPIPWAASRLIIRLNQTDSNYIALSQDNGRRMEILANSWEFQHSIQQLNQNQCRWHSVFGIVIRLETE